MLVLSKQFRITSNMVNYLIRMFIGIIMVFMHFFTGKKSRRTKSKAVLKRLEKDRRMKERQRRLENPENDNDETSSTTTESSSLEADDKVARCSQSIDND